MSESTVYSEKCDGVEFDFSDYPYEVFQRALFLEASSEVIWWSKNDKHSFNYNEFGTRRNIKPEFIVQYFDGSVHLELIQTEDNEYIDEDCLNFIISHCEDNRIIFSFVENPNELSKVFQDILILEGPDNCGKSHIGRKLEYELNLPYFRFNKQHNYWKEDKFKTALEFDQPMKLQLLQQLNTGCIIDRSYPSEWVYSKVFSRKTNNKLLSELDCSYRDLQAIHLIFLRRSYDNVNQDEVVSTDKLVDIHNEYLKFIDWTKCSCIVMHVDDYQDNLRHEFSYLQDAIRSLKRHQYKNPFIKKIIKL